MSESEEAHEAVRPEPQRRRWDGFAAAIATFIGLLALAVSGYTAYLQRRQLRAHEQHLGAFLDALAEPTVLPPRAAAGGRASSCGQLSLF